MLQVAPSVWLLSSPRVWDRFTPRSLHRASDPPQLTKATVCPRHQCVLPVHGAELPGKHRALPAAAVRRSVDGHCGTRGSLIAGEESAAMRMNPQLVLVEAAGGGAGRCVSPSSGLQHLHTNRRHKEGDYVLQFCLNPPPAEEPRLAGRRAELPACHSWLHASV